MRRVPAGIELRQATPADVDIVIDLVEGGIAGYREWAPDWTPPPVSPEMRERLDPLFSDDGRAWILLALRGEDLVGVASMSTVTGADQRKPPEGTVYLWQMFVRRDQQGSGLAGALLDRLCDEARTRGYDRFILWAAEGATQARRFYEREGFTLTGETQNELDFGLPLVQYGRQI